MADALRGTNQIMKHLKTVSSKDNTRTVNQAIRISI